MTEKITCPRRVEGWHYDVRGEDEFTLRRGMSGAPKLMLCSYCGCLDPEEYLRGIESGEYVSGPTDKSYKIYVDDANHSYGEIAEGILSYATIAKFYTMHFSEEQAWRWHQLRASGKMKIGYPGDFYTQLYMPGVQKRIEAEAVDG